MISEHAQPSQIADNPTWRLVIAPVKGVVSFARSEPGADVAPGSVVAAVNTLRDTFDVIAPHGGTVIEWLVEDGDPVSPGQPLLRLHPTQA
jgi:[acyl-carrier-protein] S-malonyltransferase